MATTYYGQLTTPTAPDREALELASDVAPTLPNEAHQMLRSLERAFEQSFSVVDCSTGQLLRPAPHSLPIDLDKRLPSCEQIARRGRPEVLDEVSPLLLFAVPLVGCTTEASLVAVGVFVTERVKCEAEVTAAAHEFGIDVECAFRWAEAQNALDSECAARDQRRHRRENRAAAIERPAQAADDRYFVAPADDVRGNHAAAPPHRTPFDLPKCHRYLRSFQSTGWAT